jgi:plasmid maintenance system killer protein
LDHIEKIEHILFVLNRTPKSADMRLPGCTLYPLKGNINGFYTVTVMANWRIIFRLEDGHAFDIELTSIERRIPRRIKNPLHPGRIVRQGVR